MSKLHTTPPQTNLIHYLGTQAAAIEAWFCTQWQETPPPLYGSVDLRNAGFKIAPVDHNLFPAGFNNLDLSNMPLYIQAAQATIAETHPQVKRLLLIPESHTRNLFYLESVAVLQTILIQAGFEVRIGTLDADIAQNQWHTLPSGKTLLIEPIKQHGGRIGVEDFFPCMIILNNDLSSGTPSILQNLTQQIILPTAQLGWNRRLKSEHFHHYQTVCNLFADHFQLDPWFIMPYFNQCHNIDFKQQTGQACLVEHARQLLDNIKEKYAQYDIRHQPFLVVKADQGTYGMAVMMIDEPEQLLQLNRKERTKMSVIKGGAPVSRVIIQEGVHTFETVGNDKNVAEPVIYLIGRHVIGGFYRVHRERGPRQNLNAPGMNFKPLAIRSSCHFHNNDNHTTRFYVYGVIARLAQLAAARELKALQTINHSKVNCHD